MDRQHIPDPFREGRLRLPEGTPSPLEDPAPRPQASPLPGQQKGQGCNRCGCSCLVLLLGLVAAVGTVMALFGEQAREYIEAELSRLTQGIVVAPSFGNKPNLHDHPPVPLGDINDDGIADLATVGFVVLQSEVRPEVLALSGSDGRQIWTALVPGNDNSGFLAASGSELLAVRGRTVSSLDQRSGTARWSRELPDTVVNSDGRPALYFDSAHAVVQSQDNRLSGIDLRSGRVAWERTLDQQTPTPLQQLGGSVCAEERSDSEAKLLCYAIDSGRVDAPIALGSWPDFARWMLHDDPTRPAVYRLWEQQAEHRIERLSPDGTLLWARSLKGRLRPASLPEARLLAGQGRVVYSTDEALIVVNAQDPDHVMTVQHADVRLFPVALDSSLLYAIAVSQRGTARIRVVGIDTETGGLRWETRRLGPLEGQPWPASADWSLIPGQGLLGVWKDGEHDYQTHIGLINQRGQIVWEQALGTGSLIGPSAFSYDKQNAYLAENRFLAAISLQGGTVRWRLGEERR